MILSHAAFRSLTRPGAAFQQKRLSFAKFSILMITTLFLSAAFVACDSDGGSKGSNTVADTTPPSAVTNLTAQRTVSGKAELSWTNPSDSDFTAVEITWTPADGETQPKEVGGTAGAAGTAEITGLNDDTEYTFTVKAKDSSSNLSGGVTVNVGKYTALVANFVISSETEWNTFANGVNGGNTYEGKVIALDSDITISSLTPAGSCTISTTAVTGKAFKGTLEGQNHTITVSYNGSEGCVGLFGWNWGTIKNLKVAGNITTSSSDNFCGAVAAVNTGTIEGCTNNATIDAGSLHMAGGIAGYSAGEKIRFPGGNEDLTLPGAVGLITKCQNNGNVTGLNKVGGIAGENAGTISYSASKGKIDGTNAGRKNGVGGIAGRNGCNNASYEVGIIESCYFTGTVGRAGQKWTGGMTGFNADNCIIKNCYMAGTLVAGAGYNNAIAGNQEGASTTDNNYSLNTISNVGTTVQETGIRVSENDLKGLTGDAVNLNSGGAYKVNNDPGVNGGWPLLRWQ